MTTNLIHYYNRIIIAFRPFFQQSIEPTSHIFRVLKTSSNTTDFNIKNSPCNGVYQFWSRKFALLLARNWARLKHGLLRPSKLSARKITLNMDIIVRLQSIRNQKNGFSLILRSLPGSRKLYFPLHPTILIILVLGLVFHCDIERRLLQGKVLMTSRSSWRILMRKT